VAVEVAHKLASSLRSPRAGSSCSIAALLVFFTCQTLSGAAANGETRTISFHHVHTKEDLTVTYKRNGRYDEEALKQINNVLRDWREQEPTKMDPQVIDLLWEVHREVGAKAPISIICGYRSPGTNAMLRKRSSGVAKLSQHMNGKAIDFFIPGVPLEELQAAGLRAQRGGVGIYPGSNFVHMDTGSVRHWPRMPEAQVARILAKGQLASASASDNGSTVTVAQAASTRKPSFLSRLFGRKDEEDNDETAAETPTPARAAMIAPAPREKPAAAKPAVATAAAVPVPAARPARTDTYQVASADSKPVPAPRAESVKPASSAAKTVAVVVKPDDESIPVAAKPAPAAGTFEVASATSKPVRPAQASSLVARSGAQTASADPATTAALAPWPLAGRADAEPASSTLAYAAQSTPSAAARPHPMGAGTTRTAPDTTVAAKRTDERPAAGSTAAKPKGETPVQVGDRFNDPWMRAMIVSPSTQSVMRATLFGTQDMRSLVSHMHKPASAVMITFSAEANAGMTTDKFTGNAVSFVSTISFGAPRTAALR